MRLAFEWGDPVAMDLDSLRVAAALAEAGGRDRFTPFDPGHVGRHLALNGHTVARRLRGMVHAGILRARPEGAATAYRFTDGGLSICAAEVNRLAALLIPMMHLRDDRDAA